MASMTTTAPTWFGRRQRRTSAFGDLVRWRRDGVEITVPTPRAFQYNGPTSDNSQSTSLTAAATVYSDPTSKKVKKKTKSLDQGWQDEAYVMYDQVGELHYVSTAIANRMGQATLYVEKNGERVEDSEDDDAILALITPQMVERMGLHLFIAGATWLAGLPKEGETATDATTSDRQEWKVFSTVEAKVEQGVLKVDEGEGPRQYKVDDISLTRIHDPHPARFLEADSPVRAALPVLRELVGLTQHVSSQIDSRLAGAGVYWIPNEILSSAKVPEPVEGQQTFSDNPVLNAIMNAMLAPLEDRSNASAVVPLLMGAPGDHISKIRKDDFSTTFDKTTPQLREEAIRRLGLDLDAPPELLLGMGDANHWGMWLVRDEVIQAHVAPRLDLIADALTTGFYRPIKAQQPGETLETVDSYDLRFDVNHLVQRPNRLADASSLHAVGAINDKALVEAGGFKKEDMPSTMEKAISTALSIATNNPQLLDNMPEIVAAIVALLDGTPESGAGTVQSQREPGTLTPLNPQNRPVAPPPTASAPNGTPLNNGGSVAPVGSVEGEPAAGAPV